MERVLSDYKLASLYAKLRSEESSGRTPGDVYDELIIILGGRIGNKDFKYKDFIDWVDYSANLSEVERRNFQLQLKIYSAKDRFRRSINT